MTRTNISFTKTDGFTLVEVLVVLSITAIIVGVTTPSFMNIVANNRVTTASNELVAMLNLGKSEAIRSGMTTVLCASQATNQCDNAASWSDGLILFQDNNNNGSINADEKVIKTISASDDSLEFAYNTAGIKKLKFKPGGQVHLNGNTTQINLNGSFCFKNTYKTENSRSVIITQSGRIRSETKPYAC